MRVQDIGFLDNLPRFVFFTGKGGVGKTSLACATALRLAEAGKRVLLTSTDPASNVGQTFGVAVGHAITPIPHVPGLDALEIDPERAAELYRERALAPVRNVLPAAEVTALTEQLSGSCTTEIASFDEFTSLLATPDATGDYDHVVFDTAPTGHTIRLLQLPGEWTDFLERGKGDASCLGPLAGLDRQRAEYARAVEVLRDPDATRLVLVTRAQPSPLDEAARTAHELAEVGLTHPHLVINAVLPETGSHDPLADAIREREAAAVSAIPGALVDLSRTVLPLMGADTVGVENLRQLLAPAAPGSLADEPAHDSTPPAPTDERLRDLVDEIEAGGSAGLIMCMGKGGVGKTTVAAALAIALTRRGHRVHLTTTDPAAHLAAALDSESVDSGSATADTRISHSLTDEVEGLRVTRIDPDQALSEYTERVMATQGKGMDDENRAALAEDLRSPCTAEIAVFQRFSRAVSESRHSFVVMDTAPTGHTLLLMDTTGAYHRQMAHQMQKMGRFATPLTRLQDPEQTKIVLVTLPETTPVLEASGLADDLRRAGIEPWAWVVNQSLSAATPTDPLLRTRAAHETGPLTRVREATDRLAVIPTLSHQPVGVAALAALTQ